MKKCLLVGTRTSGKDAFSLVEMLMALLVASLLLAALAPVMTKKMNENIIVSGTGNAILPTGGCIVTEGLQEDFCEVPQNTFSINAIVASGGGGGGGAAMGSYGREIFEPIISGQTGSDTQNTKNYTITKNMRNVTVQLVGGGGGAGAGWSNEGGYPASQADCGDWGVFIGTDYSPMYGDVNMRHSVCVSRRNPEINGGGAAPKVNVSGVSVIKANSSEFCTNQNYNAGLCCWAGGKTASVCDTSNGDYSGCNRGVCQWNAANIVCNNWNPASSAGGSMGRLPIIAEFSYWMSGLNAGILNKYKSTYQTNYPGLQLCGNLVSDRYSQCAGGEYCKIESNNRNGCYPRENWTSNCYDTSTGARQCQTLISADSGGGFGQGGNEIKYQFGVRCVVDRISNFTSYTGGGGGSGLYIKVKIPNEVIRKATKNGGNARLELSAGSGGKGIGAGNYNNSGTTRYGDDGQPSRAEIYAEAGSRIWAIQVPGGRAAYAARKTGHGGAGTSINRDADDAKNACRYLNEYSENQDVRVEKAIACNKIPDNGVVLELQAGNAGSVGNGGRGFFDGVQPASAGVSAVTAGSDGTSGGGGGGGQCTIGSTRLVPNCAAGGNGGAGKAKLSYQYYYPGVGGSGGGAGALVHIRNISNGIRPGVKITMNAGAGGNGGMAGAVGGNGASGSDGGASYISYSTNGTNILKFEVKGGGGATGGVSGKPDENILPDAGNAGVKSSVDTAKLNSLIGRTNYKIYPENLDKTSGKKAEYTGNYTLSAGANGGINSKISPVTSKPCGGFSTQAIDYYGAKDINEADLVCDFLTTNMAMPQKLVRDDIPGTFAPNMAAILSDENQDKYAGSIIPGATGGGGGSWSWLEDGEEKATAGEKGLGGYVIIYWNLQ